MADVKFCRERQLICVYYPGVVQNTDRMLETLDGLGAISKVHSDSSRRLELRFRHKDVYSKPAFADRLKTTNVLMKVVRRRKSCQGKMLDSYIYHAEILGIVGTSYKFRSLVDFQYLPMLKNESGYEPILDKLVPQSLVPLSWLQQDVPLFIIPPIFSRIEHPTDYFFRQDPTPRQNPDATIAKAKEVMLTIGKYRARRSIHTAIFNYEKNSPVPMNPHHIAVEQMKLKIKDRDEIAAVEKAFHDQPIWSKNALVGKGIAQKEKLKTMLPAFAYYSLGGPWRGLWVKFGYDPQKDPTAKIYQLLDFRVPHRNLTDKISVRRKHTGYNILMKAASTQAKTSVIQKTVFDEPSAGFSGAADKAVSPQSKEACYMFRPGMVPACRQMFYQFCDVHLEEVQALIHANDGKEEKCEEHEGWISSATMDKCREHIKNYLYQSISNQDEPSEEMQDEDIYDDEDYDYYEDEEPMES